jgi:hypothetical protein
MLAGISGAGAGSGGAEGEDEKDGRLMLLHAPRNIVSAEAIPKLATVRLQRRPTMFFPNSRPHPSRSQAQNPCRSNDVQPITRPLRFSFFESILYPPHQGLNPSFA